MIKVIWKSFIICVLVVGFVDNTVEETETEEVDEAQETDGSGGGEEEEEAGVDCSPLESGEAGNFPLL